MIDGQQNEDPNHAVSDFSDWTLSSGAQPVEIDAELATAIDDVLGELVSEVELDFAALLNDSGTLLGWSGGDSDEAVELLVESSGALAMGTFAAAQVLASQLGGDASRELLHHAGSRGFHLTEVAPGAALFSVWTGDLAPGFLRDRTARATRQLSRRLPKARGIGGGQESSPLDRAASGLLTDVDGRFPDPDLAPLPDPGGGIDRYTFEIG